MGGSSWSNHEYTARATLRSAKGIDTFSYSKDVHSGVKPRVVHGSLDPKKIKGVRESRDSKEHPHSTPIALGLDVTGSMHVVPQHLQKDLAKLMDLLLVKGYCEDPAILISAIGDCKSDSVPFQVGQFESGIEIENDLTNLFLEGGGGGTKSESYEVFLYFLAEKTSIDSLIKRGKKGYAFIIGDEKSYEPNTSDLHKVFGEPPEEVTSLRSLVERVKEKYNLFFIIPTETSWGRDKEHQNYWRDLVGAQQVLLVDDTRQIVPLIATTIGLMEEAVDLEDAERHLKENGFENTDGIKRELTRLDKNTGNSIVKSNPDLGITTLD